MIEVTSKPNMSEETFVERFTCLNELNWGCEKNKFVRCFFALVASYDVRMGEKTLREKMPYSLDDFGMPDFLNSMANVGLIAHKVDLISGEVDQRLLPAFVLDAKGEPYIILQKHEDGYLVFEGKTTELKKVKRAIKGALFLFNWDDEKSDPLSIEQRKASGFTWFRALNERFRKVFWQVFAISTALNVLSLSAPLFIMVIYDKVVSAKSQESLLFLCVGVFMAIAAELLLRTLRSQMLSWFSARIDFLVGSRVFGHLLALPSIYTEKASISSQIARIRSFDAVREFFSSPLFVTLIEVPSTVLMLIVIGVVSGSLIYIPLVMVVLYLSLFFYSRPLVQKNARLSAKATTERQEMFIEAAEKMHAIRCSSVTRAMYKQFRERSGDAAYYRFKSMFLSSIVDTLSQSIYMIAGTLTIVLGVQSVWDGSMTAGALILTMTLVWKALAPIKSICSALPRFEQLQSTFLQINRLMDLPSEDHKKAGISADDDLHGDVTFNKVGLKYSKEMEPVFAGLNFSIPKGGLVAIMGANGAGKSTVLKLAMGMYTPQMGSITIDGKDIRQMSPIDLRKNVAYMPQTPEFFSGSVLENLKLTNPFASDQEIKLALMQASAWDDVRKLPQGLETQMTGDGKGFFSSHLCFKIALARCYLKKSRVVFIDEMPFAFLNTKAGFEFKEKIKSWKRSRTILMVVHREDYLKMADAVIYLRKGQAPFVGSPQQFSEFKENFLEAA